MCGLVAIVSGGKPVSGEPLARATRALRHRGPDDLACWVSPDAHVGLGHVRLSLIDVAGGRQPLTNEDASIHAVVNGEFYGFEATRRDLTGRGHRFRTSTDSEILIHLYEEFGTGCLTHLRGEFAFVLWDAANRTIFAGRDRFGIKPLLYAQCDGGLVIASEMKAMMEAGIAARWNEGAVLQHLFACMDQSSTLFAGVHQVPPGHYLVAAGERLQITKYWDLNYPPADDRRTVPERDWIELLKHEFDEAVRIRLRADVPVGCLLSGGVDSSAVLGVAARHAPEPPASFTVAFGHSAYDETERARETAAFNGASCHVVNVNDADFAEHFEAAVWHGETLAFNGHAVAKYLLSKAVSEAGFKAVLSGEGADEIFAGYMFSRRDLSYGASTVGRERGPIGDIAGRPGGSSSLLQGLWEGRRDFTQFLAADFSQKFAAQNPYRALLDSIDHTQLTARHIVTQSQYIWSKSLLLNYVLAAEKLDMAHAVEVRMPFLDHKLFEAVRDIPVEFLVKNGCEKHVLREATRYYLVDRVYRAPKQPFTAPPATLRPSGSFFKYIEETLRSAVARRVPFFNIERVLSCLELLPKVAETVQIKYDAILLMLASLCVLQSRFRL